MTDISNVREPRTYEIDGPHSFFRDLALTEARRDPAAMERLERHRRECTFEKRDEPTQEQRDKMALLGLEFRAGSSVLGAGGEFDPPAYMVNLFATAGRAGRVVADLIDQVGNAFVLPQGISAIHTPRLTTGTQTNVAADNEPVDDIDMLTADAPSQVVSLEGQEDMSQQLYDLTPAPGMDYIMHTDLMRAYNKNLESQLINGTGGTTSGVGSQILGLTNIQPPAANTISGASVTPGATGVSVLWPLLGQAFGQVGNSRLLPPEAWLLSPRRWAWIAGGLDSSNRPLASPGGATFHATSTDFPTAGGTRAFGPLVGIPAYVTGGIPTTTGLSESIYAIRPADFFLWESTPKFFTTPQPQSGTLGVRISFRRYAAAILNRYPTGIGVVNLITQPTGY